MRKEFLPFSRPCINDDDIAAVVKVLKSGWITTGPENAEFEKIFCNYTNSRNAIALTSGTAGMHLLLNALGIGKGDEVITPSMTWVSTVNLICLAGARPVFADIDKDTLMVTGDSVNQCISQRTKMIIPVHFAGAPADIDPIKKLIKDKDIFFLEDAAHALGTEYKNKKIGSNGTAIFSFHPIKNITTGEGGIFVSDDDELADKIRRLKFHGLGVDAYDRNTQGRSPQAEVLEPGYKYNMPDISAALGISQLKRIDEFNEKRQQLAELYLSLLENVDEIMPLSLPGKEMKHSWHLFIVRLDINQSGMTRDKFMEKLKKKNIGTGIHFKAVHLQKYYRETMKTESHNLPNTEWNSERICSLPLFPDMTDKDVKDVVRAIKDILKK